MPVLQVELPPNELFKAVEQLSLPDLEQFSRQVTTLVAQRRAPVLAKPEAELLQKINQSVLSSEKQTRYEELLNKRMEEKITPVEMDELMLLTDQLEALNVERISALAKLAQIRQTTLPNLMKNLGLKEPPVV
ncbi:MAG: STAS/SEC14 domain-containing protein [Anaerolineales bacterium]|nr:STAS/SEC14 domain-containing protein [Anaerolineales bacterium]